MMDDQKILDNAPEGATHIEDNSNLYIKVLPRVTSTIFNDWFIFEIDQWIIIDTYNVLLMRSLADIRELVELRKANAELKDGLAFCLPYAEWALQGQMFNKGIIEAKKLLENHGQTKALKAGN
jgi:hypothetical protein